MSCTISLSNGKVFTGLDVNNNCFVSKTPVYESDFEGGLKRVVLSGSIEQDGETVPIEPRELLHMKLGRVFQVEGLYYFYFEEMTQQELEHLQDRADIDYLAVMSGVEL